MPETDDGPDWIEAALAREERREALEAATKEQAKMSYRFKIKPEIVWFLFVTAAMPVLLALADFDPDTITDWRTWAVGLLAASVRAVAAALLAMKSGGFK